MRTLLFVILLCSFHFSFAQNQSAEVKNETVLTTRFGFKAGLNRSMVWGHELNGARVGYIGTEAYGSFFSDTKLSRFISLENELLISWTNDYHFIEIPIHLKYHFTNKWKGFAGPKLDFIADNDNDPFESSYKFRNLGASLELGLQYYITSWLLAETRYSKGLIKQITDSFFDINEARRNTFRIGAGITF